jgi:hypothetical protein
LEFERDEKDTTWIISPDSQSMINRYCHSGRNCGRTITPTTFPKILERVLSNVLAEGEIQTYLNNEGTMLIVLWHFQVDLAVDSERMGSMIRQLL